MGVYKGRWMEEGWVHVGFVLRGIDEDGVPFDTRRIHATENGARRAMEEWRENGPDVRILGYDQLWTLPQWYDEVVYDWPQRREA